MSILEPTTPEAGAYHLERQANEASRRSIRRRITAAAIAIVAASWGANAYSSFTAHTIESRQATNTALQLRADKRAAANDACQIRYFYAVLKDVKLAFEKDSNPNDYAKAPKCSAH